MEDSARIHESARCGRYPIAVDKSNPSMRGPPWCRSSKPNMHELSDSWELTSKNKASEAQCFSAFDGIITFFSGRGFFFNAMFGKRIAIWMYYCVVKGRLSRTAPTGNRMRNGPVGVINSWIANP